MAQPSFPQETPEQQELQRNLKTALQKFIQQLRSFIKNPHEAESGATLTKFAAIIEQLHPLSDHAASLDESYEILHDAGLIIQNVLTQVLFVPGGHPDTSLLKAAQIFDIENARVSDLRKILLSFFQFPNPTEMMLRELEMLENDL